MSALAAPTVDLARQVDAAVWARNGKRKGAEILFTCPYPERHEHGDAHPSARWNPAKQVWCCDVCGGKGRCVELARLLGVTDAEARAAPLPNSQRLRDREVGKSAAAAEPVRPGWSREWAYYGPDGVTVLARHLRYDRGAGEKVCPWATADYRQSGGTIRTPVLPLYNWPALRSAPADAVVYLVEGEPATDACTQAGLLAVSLPVGCSCLAPRSTCGRRGCSTRLAQRCCGCNRFVHRGGSLQ